MAVDNIMPKKSIIEEIESEKTRLQEITAQVKAWEEDGIDVSEIKNALSMNKGISEIEQRFLEYTNNIPIIYDMRRTIAALNFTGFEKEKQSLILKMNSPRKAKECQTELAVLAEKIKKYNESVEISSLENYRREAMAGKIAEWKKRGFNTSKLEGAMRTNMDDAEKELGVFEGNIQKLSALRPALNSLKQRDFKEDFEKIAGKFSNPYLASEIEKDIETLKESIQKYGDIPRSERGNYRRKISKYKIDGYNVGHLERLIGGSLPLLAKEVDTYEKKIRALRDMGVWLDCSQDTAGYEADCKIIRSRLRDPYSLDETRKMFETLRAKIEKKMEEQAKQQAALFAQYQSQMQPPQQVQYQQPSQVADDSSKQVNPPQPQPWQFAPQSPPQQFPPQFAYRPPPQPQFQGPIRNIEEIAEDGTKEEWFALFNTNLRKKSKITLPPLDISKSKFPNYGLKRLVELFVESEDFFRLATEVKVVMEFRIVNLNQLIRGDDSTLRGLSALCGLLYNRDARYNPTSDTDYKYLEIILGCFSDPKKEGDDTVWSIKTQNKEIKIKAAFDSKEKEWVYTVVSADKA